MKLIIELPESAVAMVCTLRRVDKFKRFSADEVIESLILQEHSAVTTPAVAPTASGQERE